MDPVTTHAATTAAAGLFDTNFDIALTITLGTLMPAIAIGWIGSSAVNAIGRNPEAGAKVQTLAILAIAFAEAVAIYALVVALVMKFV